MNFELTPEHLEFQRSFRAFCAERIGRYAEEADTNAQVPKASWDAVLESGYIGMFHPRALGGTAADGIRQGIAMECMAEACAATTLAATVSSILFGKQVYNFGTPEQHQKWLVPVIRGEKLGCAASTERGSGCDLGSLKTEVKRISGGYLLNGEKCQIANSTFADFAVVGARLQAGKDASPHDRIGMTRAFVVDLRQTKGIRRKRLVMTGMRALGWGTIELDNVEIPDEDCLLPASFDRVMNAIEWGHVELCLAAGGIGVAALDEATRYVRQRHTLDKPLWHIPAVQERLATAHARLEAARLLSLNCIWLLSQDLPARELLRAAKVAATEAAYEATQVSTLVHGGWGMVSSSRVERLARDILPFLPAGQANDRIRSLLGSALLGVDPNALTAFDWAPRLTEP